MKHLKHMFMLLALLCMTLTSCLDSSSSDSTPSAYGLVEVVNYMGTTCFKSTTGVLLYPTSTSLSSVSSTYNFKPSSTKIAYIGYEYDADAVTSNITSLTVTLTYAVSLDATVEIVEQEGDLNDSIATSPIYEISNIMSSSSSEKFSVVNDHYLVTGLTYYFYAKAHYFTLVYYPEEQEDESVVKLHLRHSGNAESASVTTTSLQAYQSGYPYLYFKAFDLDELPDISNAKTLEITADIAAYNDLSKAQEAVYTVTLNK